MTRFWSCSALHNWGPGLVPDKAALSQIRIFDDLAKTVEYARMVEAAGASLLAVHGRTREQKQAKHVRANWDYIKVRLRTPEAGP